MAQGTPARTLGSGCLADPEAGYAWAMDNDGSITTKPAISVESRSGVLVVTTDSDDAGIAAARAAAAELASRCEVPLVLYDRSEETWGDTQHPEGPLAAGDARLEARTHLVSQMSEATRIGAEAVAWVSTLPSISAVQTALSDTGADVVVVPAALDQKLLERALVGDGLTEKLENQLDRNDFVDATVIEVAADGTCTVC